MVLSAKKIAEQIRLGNDCQPTGIAIVPTPDLALLEANGEAAVNLRLGRWFLTLRQSSKTHLETDPAIKTNENQFSRRHFVPFGEVIVLHPNRFLLATTLEWVRLPPEYSALVVGKSTLGRRGIIIEAAAGVHPGFSGCLTLEIANVGEVPVRLVAGMMICQLFFYGVEGEASSSQTSLGGQRKPRLGQLRSDPILAGLIKSKR